MAKQSVISVGFLKWGIRTKNEIIADTLLRIKAEDGRIIHFTRYKKRILARLVEMNLLGRCPRSGVYFQRSWPEIHRILEIEEKTFVTITHKVLFKYSFKDIAYSTGLQYMFRLQEDGGTLNGKPKKRKDLLLGPHLHPSVHKGGIAHSLAMEWFGRSLFWSQCRRKSCQDRGLIRFTRRTAKVKDYKDGEMPPETDGDTVYHAFDITSACNIRVRFKFSVPRWIRVTLEKRVAYDRKEGAYVRIK